MEYSSSPDAILPKRGNYPGAVAFTATNAPTSGRRNNRGLEGVSITPDGKRLFSLLQSPTIQDAGGANLGRNTRLLVFDVDPVSATFRQTIGEYIYRLTLNATPETNRNTPASEVLALNRTQFLVLERDSLGLQPMRCACRAAKAQKPSSTASSSRTQRTSSKPAWRHRSSAVALSATSANPMPPSPAPRRRAPRRQGAPPRASTRSV